MTIPADIAAWEVEIRTALTAARAELAAGDAPLREERWHRLEDQAVGRARHARNLPRISGGAAALDQIVDQITDLTEGLRRYGGGDPDDHHISETQFFLLYYVAAHVHAGVLAEPAAGTVVQSCWEMAETEAEGEGDAEEDDEPPWEISRPPPAGVAAWFAEINEVWKQSSDPPPLRGEGGIPVLAEAGDLRAAAVILALQRRGAAPSAEAVYALIGVIEEMEEDISTMGPELEDLKRVPPLAFTLYYVWTHILIGHADEATAQAVVAAASERLADFPAVGKPGRGSSRIRRRN